MTDIARSYAANQILGMIRTEQNIQRTQTLKYAKITPLVAVYIIDHTDFLSEPITIKYFQAPRGHEIHIGLYEKTYTRSNGGYNAEDMEAGGPEFGAYHDHLTETTTIREWLDRQGEFDLEFLVGAYMNYQWGNQAVQPYASN